MARDSAGISVEVGDAVVVHLTPGLAVGKVVHVASGLGLDQTAEAVRKAVVLVAIERPMLPDGRIIDCLKIVAQEAASNINVKP